MTVRLYLLLVSIVVALGVLESHGETSMLVVKVAGDTAYLPYTVTWIQGPYPAKADVRQMRPYQVLDPKQGDSGSVMQAYYHTPISDQITVFNLRHLPTKMNDDHLIHFIVNDWRVYKDRISGRKALAGAGYRNDSAFAFKLVPETGEFDSLFLASGTDGTGDEFWLPQISVIHLGDYDFDQNQESFFYLNSELEGTPRTLFCVEMETLTLEWQLPVASTVTADRFHPCGTPESPQVLFATYNPNQGLCDSNFSDSISHLVKLNSRGEILYKHILARHIGGVNLTPSDQPGTFFLTAEVACFSEGSSNDEATGAYGIYKIDSNGNILREREVTGIPYDIWNQPWASGRNSKLFVRMSDDRLRVYDDDIELISESEPTKLLNYFGSIQLANQARSCFVYQNGIYSHEWEQLLAFPFGIGYFQPLSFDDAGNLTSFVAGNTNQGIVAEIVRRDLGETLTIFYMKNRNYIFILLGALILLLVVLNHYRLKTKANLKVIAIQKDALEQSQSKLTASHERLREAFQKLEAATNEIAERRAREAAAEQYRVASGQFRHEINNALGAVKISLTNIVESHDREDAKGLEARCGRLEAALTYLFDQIPSIDGNLRTRALSELQEFKRLHREIAGSLKSPALAGVDRCLRLAEKLRKYESIDRDDSMQQVDLHNLIDEVLQARATTIQDRGIDVAIDVPQDLKMDASRDLLYVMISNLLENSVDALQAKLEGRREVRIGVSREEEGRLRIVWHDSGIGIPQDLRERVFQPFFSEKPTSGSGLGLSMVRSIVEKYAGQIRIESEPGTFTRFLIDFPGR